MTHTACTALSPKITYAASAPVNYAAPALSFTAPAPANRRAVKCRSPWALITFATPRVLLPRRIRLGDVETTLVPTSGCRLVLCLKISLAVTRMARTIAPSVSANAPRAVSALQPHQSVDYSTWNFVSDSKRAMGEITPGIFLNGMNVSVMRNTCEESFSAAPLDLDLLCTHGECPVDQLARNGSNTGSSCSGSSGIATCPPVSRLTFCAFRKLKGASSTL